MWFWLLSKNNRMQNEQRVEMESTIRTNKNFTLKPRFLILPA